MNGICHSLIAAHFTAAHLVMLHSMHARESFDAHVDSLRGELRRRRGVLAKLGLVLSVLLPRLPGIDVITPTWKRRDLLLTRCVPSVREQDYEGTVRHIIVSDGPDPELADVPDVWFKDEHVSEPNRGLSARVAGIDLGREPVLAYLDDDNAYRPAHLQVLAAALVSSGADFAYSRALVRESGYTDYVIGANPPEPGQIDTSLLMHRRDLLGVACWRESPDQPADWDLVQRWMDGGATWVRVPRVTLDYWAHRTSKRVPNSGLRVTQ